MKGWLKAAWHDPVGSKVIAGIILATLGSLVALVGVLWSKSDFSTNAGEAWPAAKRALLSFVTWTATSLSISLASFALIICLGFLGWACAALMWLYYVKGRIEWFTFGADALRKGFPPIATTPMPPNEPLPTDELPRVSTSQARKPSRPALFEVLPDKPQPPLPDAKALTQPQRITLMMLYREYPRAINLAALAGVMGLRYPEAEQVCERMAETNLILIAAGMHSASAVFLTKLGRDYYLKNGLDLLE